MEVYKPRPDRPMWNKVLYKKQPYADNHVDSTFLASLRTNGETAMDPNNYGIPC